MLLEAEESIKSKAGKVRGGPNEGSNVRALGRGCCNDGVEVVNGIKAGRRMTRKGKKGEKVGWRDGE